MKRCPLCAEEIQDEAIKCKHCGSMLNKPQLKWYQRTAALVIGFLCVGPLVLPLIWRHPHLRPKAKVIWTVLIIVVSYYLIVLTYNSLKSINSYYQAILRGFSG